MVRALMSRDRLRQTSKVVTQLTKPQATNITCVHMIYLCVLVMDDSNECKSIEFANIKDPLLAFAEDFSKSGQGRVTSSYKYQREEESQPQTNITEKANIRGKGVS